MQNTALPILIRPVGVRGYEAKKLLQEAGINFIEEFTESDESPRVISPDHVYPWKNINGITAFVATTVQSRAA